MYFEVQRQTWFQRPSVFMDPNMEVSQVVPKTGVHSYNATVITSMRVYASSCLFRQSISGFGFWSTGHTLTLHITLLLRLRSQVVRVTEKDGADNHPQATAVPQGELDGWRCVNANTQVRAMLNRDARLRSGHH
eukprot:scpid59405/ scgid33099/ 